MSTDGWSPAFAVLDPSLRLLAFYPTDTAGTGSVGSAPESILDLSRCRLARGGRRRYGATLLHTFLVCGTRAKTSDVRSGVVVGTKDGESMQEWFAGERGV